MKNQNTAATTPSRVGFESLETLALPTTWNWTTTGMGGQALTTTLKLKLDGDKLTGAVMGRNDQETAIEDATYMNGLDVPPIGDHATVRAYSSWKSS
jgi:hypothetical protein